MSLPVCKCIMYMKVPSEARIVCQIPSTRLTGDSEPPDVAGTELNSNARPMSMFNI